MVRDWLSDNIFRVMAEDKGTGGEGGGKEDTSDKDDDENTEDEIDLDKLDDKTKAAIAKARQKEIDDAVAAATKKTKEDTLAEVKADKLKAERAANKKAAEAAGDTAKALELEKQEIADAKKALEDAKAEATKLLNEAKMTKIAAKYNLPERLHTRLTGTNEAEWEADAKELAKDIPAKTKTAETEGGNRTSKGTAEQQAEAAKNVAYTATSMF